MGALPIGKADGMEHRRLAASVHRLHFDELGMQREGRVERERRRAVLRERAARWREVGIADRRHGAEPVHAAAQDDHHEAIAGPPAAARERQR